MRVSVPLLRALFAVVALVGQLAVSSLVLPDRSDAAALSRVDAATVLCMSGTTTQTPPAHRHHPLHAARPLDLALELPAVILLPGSGLPPPRLPIGGERILLPPARAPPAATAWAWRARDPPDLA
ncbi:hypothetical protein [Lichenicola sp.]|uniref:hypothetical protein n=1 Tax=Lichenicola sp. TaxID=2804529 RepID=UPI003B005A76